MSESLFATQLVHADHVRSFQIRTAFPAGWEVSEHDNQQTVYQQRYADWHRVERTLVRFKLEIAELRRQGWRDLTASPD